MAFFSKLELKVFQTISQTGRTNVSNLALGLRISKSAISRSVSSLEKKGLVESKKGRRKELQIARSVSARPFEELMTANPFIDFSTVFQNSNFRALSALCFRESASFKSIIRTTGLKEITARRALFALANAGMIRRQNNQYGILLPALKASVQEYLRVLMMRREGVVGSAFVSVGPNGFVRSDKDLSYVFTQTGLSVFPKYGISLVSENGDYVFNEFFKPKPPNKEDAVLHALARFAYDPSTREVSYCLLVIAKNWRTFNWERFFEHSEDYNLSEDAKKCRMFFQHFAEFLRKERDNSDRITLSTGLGTLNYPDFESFSELCDQYGIDTAPFSKG
jgi:DNA-binding MarR family transcriptional regulator